MSDFARQPSDSGWIDGISDSSRGLAAGTESTRVIRGGAVPGYPPSCPDAPAFSLHCPQPSPVPVLIAVPHAGRAYAPSLLERMRHPDCAAQRLEDRFVDLLATAVARETGATLLLAHAPRAMIDLNRAPDDVDWDMVGLPPPDGALPRGEAGRRARNGLGLVPRRLPGLGELWNRRLDHSELQARIAQVHTPYHAALDKALADLRQRWGAALLIDLHSMPPLSPRSPGETPPEFVLGDRFGATCDGTLVATAFHHFAALGRKIAHNRPYAGGYVLERHAARQSGVHCLQLEIDRQSYLDEQLVEPGLGFDAMVDVLIGLVRRLAIDVALLGSESGGQMADARWQDAAE